MTARPHNASTYTNHRCRCSVCRAANAAEVKRRRDERLALRVEICGRMVAAHLPEHRHGVESTYVNWGCRCADCTDVRVAGNRERAARRKSGVAA